MRYWTNEICDIDVFFIAMFLKRCIFFTWKLIELKAVHYTSSQFHIFIYIFIYTLKLQS